MSRSSARQLIHVRNDIPEKEGLRLQKFKVFKIRWKQVRNDIPEKEGLRQRLTFIIYNQFSVMSEMIFQKKKD